MKNESSITINRNKWQVADLEDFNFDYWYLVINKQLSLIKDVIK